MHHHKYLSPALVAAGLLFSFSRDASAQTPYVVTHSVGTYVPITGGNVHVPVVVNPTSMFPPWDEGYAQIALPFDFTFFEGMYSDIYVHTNGFASFTAFPPNSPSILGPPFTVPSPFNAVHNFIAPTWDDLTGDQLTSEIRSQAFGTTPNRTFVVQVTGLHDIFNPAGSNVDFQIVLHEGTGQFEIVYGTNAGIAQSTTAMENIDGTDGFNLMGTYPGCGVGCTCVPASCSSLNWQPSGKTISVQLPNQPELTAIVTAPPGAYPGTMFNVDIALRNLGLMPAPNYAYAVYLTNNNSTITGGTLLGTFNQNGQAASSVVNSPRSVTMPIGTPAGTYVYVAVVMDVNNTVTEVIETNNTVFSGPIATGPDLTGSMIAPAVAGPSEDYDFELTIENLGAPVSSPVSVSFHMSPDPFLDVGDTFLDTQLFTLVGGFDFNGTVTVTIPPGIQPSPPTYYLIADIDDTDQVIESSETNNVIASTNFIDVDGPDLVTLTFVGDDIAFRGLTYPISMQITNSGGATARDFTACVVISDNLLISLVTDTTLIETGLLTLDPGESQTLTLQPIVPTNTASGAWYIAGIADCQTVVNEAIETNNIKRRDQQITIRDVAPDFTPLEVSTSSAAASGEQLPVAVRFANLGNATGATHLRIVISENPGVTAADRAIFDSATATQLAPPGEVTSAVWASIPGDLPSGNYYVGAIVDPNGLVDEIHEDNNTVSVGPVVVVGADLAIVSPPPPPAIIGVAYARRFSAVGGAADYTWELNWTAGAPEGLSFDATLGELSGTPTPAAEGSYGMSVRVTSGNLVATKSYTLIVSLPTIGLEVVSSQLPPALALEPYQVELVAVGGTPPYRWNFAGGEVPAGLGLSEMGTIGGEPQIIGAFNFEVEVRDVTGALATGVLALDVVDPSSSITITTADVPDGEVGTHYETSFAAAGGTPDYVWRIDGKLPPGLGFDSMTAVISGTPTVAGDYGVIVEVRDERGLLDRNAYVLAVLEEGALQIINGQSSDTGLPGGKVGVVYQDANSEPVRLRAVKPGGDLSSLVWTLLEGVLPPGLTFEGRTGVIAGTPTEGGTYPFIVQVRDSSNDVARTSLVIFVEPAESIVGPGDGGGCGCSEAEPSRGSLLPFLMLFGLAGLWIFRKRKALLFAFVLAVLAAPAAAEAQPVPYQIFETMEAFEPLDATAIMMPDLSDGNTIMIPLPFEFYLYGQPYSNLWINANGVVAVTDIMFGNHYPPPSVPDQFPPNGWIGGMWADWCAGPTCGFAMLGNPGMGVFYSIDPTPGLGSITIEYRHLYHYNDETLPSNVTFQIALHEGLSSEFSVHFGPIAIGTDFLGQPTIFSPRIGIENALGTEGQWLGPCQAMPCDNATVLGLPNQKITVIADAGEDVTTAGVQVPQVGYPGLPFSSSARVLSRHQDPLGPFRYGVYLIPATSTSTAGGTLVYESAPISLAGYESREVTFDVEVPNDQAVGQYRVGLLVDLLDELDETAENNNFAFSAQTVRIADRAPDFRVLSSRPLQEEVRPGAMLEVAYRVQNFGNEPGSLTMQAVLSNNEAITISDLFFGAPSVFETAPRETVTGTLTAQVPAGISTGAYYVGLILDPDFSVPELDEANNVGRSGSTVIVASTEVAIITDALPQATIGQGYSTRLRAAGGSGTFVYALASGDLPRGMLFDTETAELSGVPLDAGVFPLEFRATSGSVSGTRTLDFTVLDPSYPLTIANRTLPDGVLGSDYAVQLIAVGGTPPYTWRLSEGSITRGVLLAPDGAVFGSPSEAGFSTFTVEVRDNQSNTASVALNLNIRSPGNLTIVTTDLPDGRIGEPYSQQLSAVGGVAPLTWRAVEDSQRPVPPGLAITGDGILTGIPEIARQYRFRVEATDARGTADTNELTMTVLATGRFSIATTELPIGEPNQDYRAVVKAEGGELPYTWQVVQGEGFLPPGFVVEQSKGIAEGESENDLIVRGKLEREGVWSFTARVYDAQGRSDERPFAIVSRVPVVVTEPPDEGCGCSAAKTEGGALWGLLLLPLALLFRRRRIARALLVASVLFAATRASRAEAQLYVPAQYGAPYVPISGGALLTIGGNTDDGTEAVALPFPFNYFGVAYSSIEVGVNGAAQFTTSCTSDTDCSGGAGFCNVNLCEYGIAFVSVPMPAADPPDRILAVMWDDMLFGFAPDSEIRTQVVGTAPNREFVMQWSNISHYDGGVPSVSRANYQIRLDEGSGAIRFHYGPFMSAADNGLWSSGVIGIENQDGTQAVVPLPCSSTPACGAPELITLANQVIEFALPVGPELVGSANSGTGGDPGAALSIVLTVNNIGTMPSGAFQSAYYFSTDDGIIEPTDTLLGTRNFTSIAAMSSAMATLATTVPNVAPGTYAVGAIIDSNNAVAEVLETNNIILATANFLVGADLSVAVQAIGPTGPNEIGSAQVGVVNNGSAQPAVGVAVYLSEDTALDPLSDYLLGTATIAVPAQPTTNVTVPTVVPGNIIPGDYYTIAAVDFAGLIAEANETNNVGVSIDTGEVTGSDVVATDAAVTGDFIFVGGQIQVSGNLRNDGGATTPPFFYGFYLSDNVLINALTDPLLGEFGPITLAPGQSIHVEHTVDVPASLAPDLYYMGLIGDSQSAVNEQFETNNISRTDDQLQARAPAPDFTVTSIELPDLGAAGESFVVARTVANAGNAAGNVAYQVYISTDSVIEPATDPLVGMGTVVLDPFTDDVGVDRLRIPPSLPTGSYYVGYEVDPEGLIDELVETNNLISSVDSIDVLANDLVILTDQLPIAITGAPYQVLFGAAGGAGRYSWSIVSGALPAGLTLDEAGLLSGAATEEGVFDFEIAVSDGSLAASKSFAVIVSDTTLPLEIVTRSLVPAFVRKPYRYPLTAFGGIPPYRWSVDGVLPGGIIFEDGLLVGTATVPYVDTLTFRVDDAAGAFAERPIALRVVSPDDTVRFSDGALPTGTLGEQYDVMLSVAPGTGTSPFTFSLADGALPGGLILEFDRISGIPGKVGIFTFALRVGDSRGDFDVNQYVLEIEEANGVSFVTSDLPSGTVDEPYTDGGARVQLRAVSAEASGGAIVYRTIGGELPPGLTLSDGGALEGTPTTSGVWPFTVLAEDELGQFEVRAFGVFVDEAAGTTPPIITDEGCGCTTSRTGEGSLAGGFLLLIGAVLLRLRLRRVLVIASCLAVPAVASAQTGTYLFQTSNEPYQERAGGTTLVFSNTDDGEATASLPFTFRYFGNNYATVTVGTNGYVTFSSDGTSRFAEPLPSTNTPNDMIALWWEDLITNSASYLVEGTTPNRVFIIQWEEAEAFFNPTGGQLKMQVMLYEGLGGRFEVRYGPIVGLTDPFAYAATSAFENFDGTVGFPLLPCAAGCTGTDFADAEGVVIRAQQDGGPDIAPSGLTLPSVAYAGIPFEVPVAIQSLHMTPLGPFVYQIHLLEPGDTTPNNPIYTSQPITLSPYQLLEEIALPATALDQASGRYRLALVVDANDDVAEPDELGNTLIAPGDFRLAARSPDFTVVAVTPAASSAQPGDTLAVQVELANAGNLDGGADWSLVLSRNRAISTDDLVVHTGTIALSLLTTATVTVQVDLPLELTPGAYYFGAVIDPEDAVAEIDEVHNDGVATLPVTIASDQLAVETVNLPSGYMDVPYSVFLRATGGDGAYQWSVTSGELPGGLALLTNGEIRGTPTASGDAQFTLRVMSANLTAEANVSIAIAVVQGGLSIVTRQLLPGILGDAYPPAEAGTPVEQQQRIVAVGGVGPISFVLKSLPPAGLTLETDGYLHGVPLSAGDYELEIEATDGTTLVERTLLLTIAEPGRLTLISSVLPDARLGEQYMVALRVVGASTTAMVRFESETTLPDGLALTELGVLIGEPQQAGSFTFSVSATDGTAAGAPRDTATFRLTVLQDESFGFGPTTLPNGIIGENYSAMLEARGGVPPFEWDVIGPDLPRGITYAMTVDEREKLAFSGVPEEEALRSFMVTLTDSEGRYAELPMAILIQAKPAVITPVKEGGCGCSTAGNQETGARAGLLAALVGIYGFIRRSRRRRR